MGSESLLYIYAIAFCCISIHMQTCLKYVNVSLKMQYFCWIRFLSYMNCEDKIVFLKYFPKNSKNMVLRLYTLIHTNDMP